MTRVTQQHLDARREAILNAAMRLFAQKGVSGATMAEIAAEADLSAGAIYRYYQSKEDLLRAVFDFSIAQNQEAFKLAAESTASPFEAMKEIGRQVWIAQTDRDSLICEVQMAVTAARDPEDLGVDLGEMRTAIRLMLEDLIRKSQASGEIDPNIDPGTLSIVLQACTAGIQMLKLQNDEDLDTEAAFSMLVAMVENLRGPGDSVRNSDQEER